MKMIIQKAHKIARASYSGRWRWSPKIRVNKIKRSMEDRFIEIKWQGMMFSLIDGEDNQNVYYQ